MKILVLSDLHANWPALRAVLEAAADVDAIICLGDLVNYGPHPAECVRWARDETVPLWIVQGNHDRALGCDEDPRCSAPYRTLAAAMQSYTANQLTTAAKDYLAALPPCVTHTMKGARMFLCHAVPSDPLYCYAQADNADRWGRECEQTGHPDFLFVGHTHLPFIRKIGGTTVVNPGSVGQPKDGDSRASYALWQDAEVTLHRVVYDIAAVTHDLAAAVSPKVSIPLSGVLLTGGHFSPSLTP
jgi:predicted phosphodiesterase